MPSAVRLQRCGPSSRARSNGLRFLPYAELSKINVNFETEQDNFVPPLRRIEHRIAVHTHRLDTKRFGSTSRVKAMKRVKRRRRTSEMVGRLLSTRVRQVQQGVPFLAAIAARREVVRFEDNEEHRGALRRAVELQTRLEVSATTERSANCSTMMLPVRWQHSSPFWRRSERLKNARSTRDRVRQTRQQQKGFRAFE